MNAVRKPLPQGEQGDVIWHHPKPFLSATIILLLPMICFLLAAAADSNLSADEILHNAAKVNGGVTPLHRPRRPLFQGATSTRTDKVRVGAGAEFLATHRISATRRSSMQTSSENGRKRIAMKPPPLVSP